MELQQSSHRVLEFWSSAAEAAAFKLNARHSNAITDRQLAFTYITHMPPTPSDLLAGTAKGLIRIIFVFVSDFLDQLIIHLS